jgi:hypothetical protein
MIHSCCLITPTRSSKLNIEKGSQIEPGVKLIILSLWTPFDQNWTVDSPFTNGPASRCCWPGCLQEIECGNAKQTATTLPWKFMKLYSTNVLVFSELLAQNANVNCWKEDRWLLLQYTLGGYARMKNPKPHLYLLSRLYTVLIKSVRKRLRNRVKRWSQLPCAKRQIPEGKHRSLHSQICDRITVWEITNNYADPFILHISV